MPICYAHGVGACETRAPGGKGGRGIPCCFAVLGDNLG